jgi:hypothetical protein
MKDLLGNLIPVDPPRLLTPGELERIGRVNRDLALRLIAGVCEHCGSSRSGVHHKDACRPARAPEEKQVGTNIRQPWVPRPSRRAAA